jgi:hypothetical protein
MCIAPIHRGRDPEWSSAHPLLHPPGGESLKAEPELRWGWGAVAAENDAIVMPAVRGARTPHLETRPRDHLYLPLANALTLTEVGRPKVDARGCGARSPAGLCADKFGGVTTVGIGCTRNL